MDDIKLDMLAELHEWPSQGTVCGEESVQELHLG